MTLQKLQQSLLQLLFWLHLASHGFVMILVEMLCAAADARRRHRWCCWCCCHPCCLLLLNSTMKNLRGFQLR
jgi:hypothetical protein